MEDQDKINSPANQSTSVQTDDAPPVSQPSPLDEQSSSIPQSQEHTSYPTSQSSSAGDQNTSTQPPPNHSETPPMTPQTPSPQPPAEGQETSPKPTISKKHISIVSVLLGLSIALLWISGVLDNRYFPFLSQTTSDTSAPAQQVRSTQTPTPTPTPDPTIDWETAATRTFRLKHPEFATADTTNENVITITYASEDELESNQITDGYIFRIQARELNNLSVQEYARIRANQLKQTDPEVVTTEVSAYQTNEYRGSSFSTQGADGKEYIFLTSNDETFYVEITISIMDPRNVGFQTTIDRILSTFEFAVIVEPTPANRVDTYFELYSICTMENNCPDKLCTLDCGDGIDQEAASCPPICIPRPCEQFDTESCPQVDGVCTLLADDTGQILCKTVE